MGSVYESLGLYDVAEGQKREALAIRQRELGPQHLEVAHSLDSLATLAYARANYQMAEELSRQVSRDLPQVTARAHADIARALSDVGRRPWPGRETPQAAEKMLSRGAGDGAAPPRPPATAASSST